MKKTKWKKINLYKPGSAKYYKDTLKNIHAVAIDYDGFNITNAKQMKELVDDLKKMASDALQHKKLYVTMEK